MFCLCELLFAAHVAVMLFVTRYAGSATVDGPQVIDVAIHN